MNSTFNDSYYELHKNRLNNIFINHAINAADNSDGGPFGAIITKNDSIISIGNNKVTVLNDPTAHAEIVAIREACKELNTFNLQDCTLYTSCEPCPMCLSAIYWSRINTVYYANTRHDAADIGFDDNEIYKEFEKSNKDKNINLIHLNNTSALNTFKRWKNNVNKISY